MPKAGYAPIADICSGRLSPRHARPLLGESQSDSASILMKPRSIVKFQWLLLTSSLLSVLNILIHYGALRAFALARGASPAGPILGILVAMGFYLLFRVGIGKAASNIAKWLFVALTAFSLVEVPINMSKTMSIGVSYALLDSLCFLLQVAAAVALFQRDASTWLKDVRPPAQPD